MDVSEYEKNCFVIQCFDGSKYDKRYKEIYKGAIEKARLKPIRADEVLGTRPIIETIESQIALCDAVLADISETNENVFLELGYALAENKPCLIICDKEARKDLPFDIRHRPVVFYDSHSPSSFDKLAHSITSHLLAEIGKDKRVRMANVKATAGEVTIEDYENIVISIILSKSASEPNGIAPYWINKEFERFGYSATTLPIALASLTNKGFVVQKELFDDEVHEKYTAYKLTDDGMRYILDNRKIFAAKNDPSPDDDTPF